MPRKAQPITRGSSRNGDPVEWIDAHAVTVGLMVAGLGWLWRLDRMVTKLGTDVSWLKDNRCPGCDLRRTSEQP